jgi:hypothetical protein
VQNSLEIARDSVGISSISKGKNATIAITSGDQLFDDYFSTIQKDQLAKGRNYASITTLKMGLTRPKSVASSGRSSRFNHVVFDDKVNTDLKYKYSDFHKNNK